MNSMESRTISKPNNADGVAAECICERPKTNLMCTDCNLSLIGRVHKICKKHPTLIYLLDLIACPCGGRLIERIEELGAKAANVPNFSSR